VSTLQIRDLHVTVNTGDEVKPILKGVDLTVKAGETHAIMGPNGSGKSTLAYSIAGHPKYTITQGSVTLDGEDVLAMTVDERARAGLFLAMQYPVEVPGVSVSNFLRTAATATRGEAPKLRTWVKEVKEAMAALDMDPAFLRRAQRQRGLLGRGEEAPRDTAARTAQAEDRDPGRDRLRPRHRRAEGRLRGRQPGALDRHHRHAADHPLHADPALHQAGLRPRLRRRADR
jgi:ABC-type dipeptide/oligopeptide/nickel transport system ATPase component